MFFYTETPTSIGEAESQVLGGSQVANYRYDEQLRIRGNPNKQSRADAVTVTCGRDATGPSDGALLGKQVPS